MQSRFARSFTELYKRWRPDIHCFAREGFRFRPTRQQAEAFEIVQDETTLPMEKRLKRLAMSSGQGVGKTTVEVVIAVWRALQDIDSLVVVTAPTMVQLTDVWIAEARRLHGNAHQVLKQMLNIDNRKITICGRPTWGIWTRSASRPENFQGYHQKNLTIIFDEASGIERGIIETAKGTLTNENSLIIASGNPNTRECAFFDMFHHPVESQMWHRRVFDARESEIVDQENVRRLILEFGEESDVVRVRVKGLFPLADPNCVMSTEDIYACQGVPMLDAVRMKGEGAFSRQFGVDFARFGGDESVIYRRSGNAIVEWRRIVKREPLDVLEMAFEMQKKAGWSDDSCLYVVDASGMGQGVMANAYRAGKKVHEFHSHGSSSRPDFANKMTEAYFHLAKLARARRMHIPVDQELAKQLTSRFYLTDAKNKLILEKKDEYMKRGPYPSPDRADALAMAFYTAGVHGARVA